LIFIENANKKAAEIKINTTDKILNVSELTKEIAAALIEIKQIHKGKIQPLTLNDI
jgi:uncharacterized small protein (DUF1192 family)